MIVILSPAKKMMETGDDFQPEQLPEFLEDTMRLKEALRARSKAERKKLWNCSDALAEKAEQMLRNDPSHPHSAAVFSYSGLAYQHLSASSMDDDMLAWIREHLRILSGFNGILRPYDGVVPYRLEMQAPLACGNAGNLYEFWNDRLYQTIADEKIINLASEEYSRAILPYAEKGQVITITFLQEHHGKLVTKGSYAKMARGDMTRWMSEQNVNEPEELRKFDLHYSYSEDLSSAEEFVFIQKQKEQRNDWE
ncbi:MAG: peroxide stress protein YaaA [Bulleidia sp.]